MLTKAREWVERTFVDLFRQLHWSFLPPLMVYFAAGISALTAIAKPDQPNGQAASSMPTAARARS